MSSRKVIFGRVRLIVVVMAMALALGFVVTACGGGDDDEEAVDAQVTSAYAAWNAKDVEGFLAAFTDNGLEATFDFSSRMRRGGRWPSLSASLR